MNSQQFGQLIKSKYPGYQDMDDDEIANRVLQRYPQYQSAITEDEAVEGEGAEVKEDDFWQKKKMEALTKPGFVGELSRAGEAVSRAQTRFLKGFGRGGVSILTQTASLGERMLGGITGVGRVPEGEKTAAEKLIPERFRKKGDTMAERIGFLGAELTEFLLPTPTIIKMERQFGIAGKKVKDIVSRALVEAGVTTGILGTQRGQITGEEVMGGALAGGILGAVGFTGKALPHIPIIKNFIKPISDDAIYRAIKPRLIKGRNLKQVQSKMTAANAEIINQGFRPDSVESYATSISQSKKNLWSEIDTRLKGAGQDTQINFKIIADQIREKAADPALMRANPSAAGQLNAYADSLIAPGEMASVIEAEKVKQILNAEMEGFFGQIQISQPMKEAKKTVTREIGKQLDTMLSYKGERGFQELKTAYGSLSEIEDDVLKRMIVFGRQNPEGLFSGLGKLAGFGDLAQGLMSTNASQVGKGLSEILMGQLIKQSNNADLLIKRGFDDMYRQLTPGQAGMLSDIKARFSGEEMPEKALDVKKKSL